MNWDLMFRYLVPVIVISIFALIAAAIDVWKLKIYNFLTLPLALSGLIYHLCLGFYTGTPIESFLLSFCGLLFGFVLLPLWLMGGMGAGDVKLLCGVGAWLGFLLTFWVLIVSSLAAGVCSILMIVTANSFKDTWANLQVLWYRIAVFGKFFGAEDSLESQVSSDKKRTRLIPFGAMLFVGLGIVSLCLYWDIIHLN